MMDLSLRLSLVLVLPTLFPVIVVSEDRGGGEKSCRTGKQDQRSDIFSLGVTLYEMLAGQVPFSADDLAQLMFQLSSAAPRPPSAVNPGGGLARVSRRARR